MQAFREIADACAEGGEAEVLVEIMPLIKGICNAVAVGAHTVIVGVKHDTASIEIVVGQDQKAVLIGRVPVHGTTERNLHGGTGTTPTDAGRQMAEVEH